MSTTQVKQCDSCGLVETINEDRRQRILQGLPVKPWWDAAFHSSDFGVPGKQGFRMRWLSWDLCSDCQKLAVAAIKAAVGEPHHDDSEEGDE